MEIKYFTPPEFIKHPFRFNDLLEELGYWQYASKGRWCLYHILKSLCIKGPVLVPIYCCESILQPIEELGLKWFCYDINSSDLNPNVESVEASIEKYGADCVVAVSMYGNPAELDRIETICNRKGVKMIDDAAQSFGSTLNGKRVGYFGNAGFFSFSPGKPLAGHLGGAFRTDNDTYKIRYKKHSFTHWVIYKDFEYNRYYNHFRNNLKGKLYGLGCKVVSKLVTIREDIYSHFEEGILYGIYKDSLYIHNPYRTEYAKRLANTVHSSYFNILKVYDDTYRKGIAHKYILICNTKEIAIRMNDYLHKHQVFSQFGYQLLTDCSEYVRAKQVEGCVVEIPLNAREQEFEYLHKLLNNFRT